MQRGHWAVATLVGIAVAAALAFVPLSWPALAIGGGAIAATVLHGVGPAPSKRYAILGTAYCLGLAAVARLGVLPTLSAGSPWRALATVGVASCLVVGLGLGLRRSIGGLVDGLVPTGGPRSTAGSVRHGVKLLGTLRTAIAVGGTVARFAGVVVGGVVATLLVGSLTFLLDGVGVSAPVPWRGGAEVDAVLLAFVVATMVGFYLLAATHAIYEAVTRGVAAGRTARSRVAAAREPATVDTGEEEVE